MKPNNGRTATDMNTRKRSSIHSEVALSSWRCKPWASNSNMPMSPIVQKSKYFNPNQFVL